MKSTRPDSAARTAGVELFDVCHVGVVLRAALFVHAALAVGVLFEVQTLRGFALQFSLATAIALPAVLAWLIAICLLKDLMADIQRRRKQPYQQRWARYAHWAAAHW